MKTTFQEIWSHRNALCELLTRLRVVRPQPPYGRPDRVVLRTQHVPMTAVTSGYAPD